MSIEALLKKDVNSHTEKKNNLTYLSWAWAWAGRGCGRGSWPPSGPAPAPATAPAPAPARLVPGPPGWPRGNPVPKICARS
jgi:hypothetical protein